MTRYHEHDALRAVAMLLGVVLHAFLFLVPIGWVGQDPWAKSVPIEQNPYVYLLAAIHGFRMPVFFVMSGFFVSATSGAPYGNPVGGAGPVGRLGIVPPGKGVDWGWWNRVRERGVGRGGPEARVGRGL